MPDQRDIYFMKMALQMARKGLGHVSPNPLVGAVLVKQNKIIGRGYHAGYGQAHAEVRAIESAAESVKGATLYCNLEPCFHSDKQTPPCAQRLIREGIKKVVIASKDPNPKVQGKGIVLLQQTGIEVVSGILAAANEELNRFYFKYMTQNMPYVTLKIAQTIDSKIAAGPASQTWITSLPSRRMVYRWRTEYDGVLVGSNTIRMDDPQLTRHTAKGRNPVRIIIAGKLRLTPAYRVFQNIAHSRAVIVCATKTVDQGKINKFKTAGCQVWQLAGNMAGRIPLEKILKKLAAEKICSVLVEGGQQIFSQFIRDDLADELKIFIAPQIWGGGIPAIGDSPINKIRHWHIHQQKRISEDVLLVYRR
jgi:diaminohydroxyphosphoribosylaminopyrimidine deaminase/5-amino-6-(5-phosphoribosylamino)uracil reductase